MKKMIILTITMLLTGLVYSAEPTHDEHSHHAAHSKQTLTLNEGQKWEIDQTMIRNMTAVMEENTRVKALVSSKKVKNEDFTQLSEQIKTSTQDIITNCKLEPKADAAFHIVLADLLMASENLKQPKSTKKGMKELSSAINAYVKYFNHPALK